MRRTLISEVIAEAGKAPSSELQAEVLKTNNSLPLRQVLLAVFDPNIKFDVKMPVYRENVEEPGCAGNSLFIEHRRLYIFLQNSPVKSEKRRSTLLAQILESIDRPDALLLEKVLQKDLSSYGVTLEGVKMAFPGLIR